MAGPHLPEKPPELDVRVGSLPGEDEVEEAPEREHVRAGVHPLAARLLRRHEERRSEDGALDREPVVGGALPRRDPAIVGVLDALGEAPVDDDGLAEVADDDVGALDVAVEDALAVRVRDGIGHGDDVGEEREPLAQGGALRDELEAQENRLGEHLREQLAILERSLPG